MLHRRKILVSGLSAAAFAATSMRAVAVQDVQDGEGLVQWILRIQGRWDPELYRRMLGAANEFKEGDALIGVAAANEQERALARKLLSHTKLKLIDANPPFNDSLSDFIREPIQADVAHRLSEWTLGELKDYLLEKSEAEIHSIRTGLSSDVIACVVRLMSNEELIRVGAKVFNPLPGTQLGAKGYMGARIQPNSPTDHPDDIRWQVFDAFAYAVGDVLVGTNPVSSEPSSVANVQSTLKDILETFGLSSTLPHCVLSHIDVQAQVEKHEPGATALWFQSIAGSDAANETFDVTTNKMFRYAAERTGPYALYFETGQGADFTNGHGQGTDMVLHESRKYGFARSLMDVVIQARRSKKLSQQAWVHLNDVAGFIGPEVFRTREQLVRCCLEDIVMGKLHGLMIGLDICTTLHMDVSLDDLGWCIDQIMPANPGYLMALPTRIDPMLGYLTTGYHDHVHIREKFGYRVNDAMWAFFQSLGVIDDRGAPTEHFGNPIHVYQAYCRRKGDTRSELEIQGEAKSKIKEVRDRGVFLAEGYGETYSQLAPNLAKDVRRIFVDAKECIWAELPKDFEESSGNFVSIKTESTDRHDYILHPVSGERITAESKSTLGSLREKYRDSVDTFLVLSDGLNALAATSNDQASRLLEALRKQLAAYGFRVVPEHAVIRSGRVRAGYQIGESLFQSRTGRCHLVHVIGERPGTGHRTLSVYLTSADGSVWSQASTVDHNITKVVSGIADTALSVELAAETVVRLLRA